MIGIFFVETDSSGGIAINPIEESEIKEVSKISAVFRVRHGGLSNFSQTHFDGIARDLGINLQVAGHDKECRYGNLFLDTCFPTTNNSQAQLVIEVDKILSEFFPCVKILCIDLKTNERRLDKDYDAFVDAKVLEWIAAGNDRWLNVFWNIWQDNDNLECLGYRPQV